MAWVILLNMEDAEHNYAVALDAIEKLVGESLGEQTSETAVANRPAFRLRFQQLDCMSDFRHQVITQTGALRLIPKPGLAYVRLRLGPDDDTPTHEWDGLRRRASTSAQVEPASGLKR